MVSNIVGVGAKVDINIYSQKERSIKTGEEVHIYKSQVCDILESGELELLMPSEAGRLVLLSLGMRYEMVFYVDGGLYKAIGEVKERYKTENRYLIKVELKTPLSKYQRRQYFRLKCVIEMKYYNITNEQAALPKTEEIIAQLRGDKFFETQKKASIVDISGGGVRFVSSEENPPESYILMIMILDNGIESKQYLIVGHVIQSERIRTDDVTDIRYENRVEYIFKETKAQEEIIKFIFAEERRTRKNEKQ